MSESDKRGFVQVGGSLGATPEAYQFVVQPASGAPAPLVDLRATLESARVALRADRFGTAVGLTNDLATKIDPIRRSSKANSAELPLLTLRLLDASARSVMAQALDAQGRESDARAEGERAAALFREGGLPLPASGEILSDYGVALAIAGDEKAAFETLREAVEVRGVTPEACRYFALLLMQRGDIETALPLMRDALTARPGDSLIAQKLADAWEAQGRIAEAAKVRRDVALQLLRSDDRRIARDLLDRALAATPDDPIALGARAEVARFDEQFKQARRWYERSIELEPSQDAYAGLAATLLSLGHPAEALAHAEEACRYGKDRLATAVRAVSLADLDRRDDAIAAIDADAMAQVPELRPIKARLLLMQKRYAEAVEELDRVLEQDPRSDEMLVAKGEALIALGRDEDALATFKAAAEVAPNTTAIWANLADLSRRAGKDDEALAAIDRAIALAASDADDTPRSECWLYGTKGQILASLDRSDEAMAAFQKAIGHDATVAWVHMSLANALQGAERWDEALAAVDRALALTPDSPPIMGAKGALLARLDRMDEAEQCLRKSFSLAPDLDAGLTLSDVLADRGKLDEALEVVQTMLTGDPDSVQLLAVKGVLLRRLTRVADSIEVLEHARELSGGAQTILEELGESCLLADQNEKAVEIFDEILGTAPESANALASKGQALLALNQAEKAVECLRQALELTDGTAWLHAMLASALMGVAKYDEAGAMLDKSMALGGENQAWILGVAGQYRTDIAEFDRGIALLEQAARLDPSQAWLLGMLGWASENVSNEAGPRARDAYTRALAIEPDNAWFHKGLGNALRMMKQGDEACAQYRQTIDILRRNGPTTSAYDCSLMGWCYYQLGEYDESQRLYLSSLEVEPNAVSSQFDLALVIGRAGRHASARKEYERALELTRTQDRARQRGLLYIALADLQEAIDDERARGIDLLTGDMGRALEELREAAAHANAADASEQPVLGA